MQIVDATHRLVVEGDDNVADSELATLCGPARLHRDQQHPGLILELLRPGDGAWDIHVLSANAEISAANPAILNQLSDDELRRVDRYRETDSLRRQNHGGVYADDFTSGIDQRSAGVAGIERGVGLDDIVDQPSRYRA